MESKTKNQEKIEQKRIYDSWLNISWDRKKKKKNTQDKINKN